MCKPSPERRADRALRPLGSAAAATSYPSGLVLHSLERGQAVLQGLRGRKHAELDSKRQAEGQSTYDHPDQAVPGGDSPPSSCRSSSLHELQGTVVWILEYRLSPQHLAATSTLSSSEPYRGHKRPTNFPLGSRQNQGQVDGAARRSLPNSHPQPLSRESPWQTAQGLGVTSWVRAILFRNPKSRSGQACAAGWGRNSGRGRVEAAPHGRLVRASSPAGRPGGVDLPGCCHRSPPGGCSRRSAPTAS